MNLRNQVVSGVAWRSISQFGTQFASICISMVLSRILTPDDYGLIAMIAVFTGFAGLFARAGLGSALIQRRELSPIQIDSVFLINVGAGTIITLTMFLVAPIIASFYSVPELKPIARVLSLTFVISSLAIVPRSLLTRNMYFKTLAKIDLLSSVTPGLVAIVFAINGYGVWSLVGSSLTSAILGLAILWFVSDWRPRLQFNWPAIKELVGFSAGMLGFESINYWARNLDSLLIGKFIGSAGLGLYNRAYFLMLLPITQLNSILSSVMFPALSSIQEDRPRIRRIYLQAMQIISFVAFPMVTGLAVVADPLIPLMYGDQWIGVIPIFRILCLVSLLQAIVNPVGWLYTSLGKTGWLFWWGIGASIVLVIGIGFGVYLGSLVAVAWSYFGANVLLFYPAIAIPGSLVGLKWVEVIAAITGPLLCSFVMAAVVIGAGRFTASWPAVFALGMSVILGSACYLVLSRVFRLSGYKLLYGLLSEKMSPIARGSLWELLAPR